MDRLGFIIICFAGMCADSECLLIPLAIASVGALLMHFGKSF